jgi:hypothetical protein
LEVKLNYLYKVEQEKPKNPIIKIVGINGISKQIEKDINSRNFADHDKKGKVIHYYKNDKTNSTTVLMEITSEMHKQIKENRDRIFVAHLCCRVFDVISVKSCFNCGRVGHSVNKCPNKVVCLKCAGKHKKKHKIYYNDSRLNRSDGVVVYIKENIIETTTIETHGRLSIMNTNIKLDKEKDFEISSIYKSHSIPVTEFVNSLEQFLKTKRKY